MMEDETATPEGVEEVIEEAVISERQSAIEAIAQRNESETTESEITEDVLEELDEPAQLVSVKVDGEQVEMSLDDVIKGYQKDATASKRLEQVAQERKDLDEARTLFEEEQQILIDKKAETEAAESQQEQLSDDTDFADKLVNTLDDLAIGNDSDKAQAANTLKELLSGRNEEVAIPVDEIAQQAANKATLQMEHKLAQSEFVKDNPDVIESANDPYRNRVFNEMFQEQLDKGVSYEKAYANTGDAYREWSGINKNAMAAKVERKQSLSTEPRAVNSRAQPTPKDKPQTTASIIETMRAGRGQPV